MLYIYKYIVLNTIFFISDIFNQILQRKKLKTQIIFMKHCKTIY